MNVGIKTESCVWTLPIRGMSCASCSGRLQKVLEGMPGMEQASVNLATAQATVRCQATLEQVIQTIRQTGFKVAEQSVTYAIKAKTGLRNDREIERSLSQISGVRHVQIHPTTGELSIRFIPETVGFEQFRTALLEFGLDLERLDAEIDPLDLAEQEQQKEIALIRKRLQVGTVLLVATLITMHWHQLGLNHLLTPYSQHTLYLWQWLLITPVQFWVGWYFHKSTLIQARSRAVNMHTLVSVGTFSAYIYSVLVLFAPELFQAQGLKAAVYFDTSGSIIVLILVGRYLEGRAKGRTSHAIRTLMALTPKTAQVLRGKEEQTVSLADVLIGDRLVVRPGEKVPVDGVIVQGEAILNESMLTGESMPVSRGPGDLVVGGTLNLTGLFHFEAQRVGRETALAHIIGLVRQAQGAKPPIARLADNISAIFVPMVMGIATLTFFVWWFFGPQPSMTYGLLNAIAVLIIACPCALGLATPTSIMVGIGKGAEMGILIRGGEALETAHKVDVVVFDKTGTLTLGQPALVDWTGNQETLAWVASAEKGSEHPLAKAVVDGAKKRGLEILTPEKFEAIPGQGIRAVVSGRNVLIGTRRLMTLENLNIDHLENQVEEMESKGQTVMYVAVNRKLAGLLAVADTVRPESAVVVANLKRLGIQVIMLTGDNHRTAWTIAGQVGITTVLAEVLPEHKGQEIERLRKEGKIVAMVGDGINDAPALALADIGIAIGTGTDVAMEASDITLISGDLKGVFRAIHLSRATMRNIRQNLFWAFAYNVILIPLAAGVLFPLFGILLSPIVAAAAMGLSSVTVVTNALRLKRFRFI
ncbi:MAG: heavy metal translocating P-type ATPase [Magnetococcus sp. DMHC-6]